MNRALERLAGFVRERAVAEGAARGSKAGAWISRLAPLKKWDRDRARNEAIAQCAEDADDDGTLVERSQWIRPVQRRTYEGLFAEAWKMSFNRRAPEIALDHRLYTPHQLGLRRTRKRA